MKKMQKGGRKGVTCPMFRMLGPLHISGTLETENSNLACRFNTRVEVEQGLTSHQTHYRSYRGRFLQVIDEGQHGFNTRGTDEKYAKLGQNGSCGAT